jgi:hypothetical protein
MAPESSDRLAGDPAFAGSDQVNVTNAPIDERERGGGSEHASLRRPFPWAMGILAVALVALAVVAMVAVGAQYGIPFLVLALLFGIFFGTHRLLALRKTRSYGGEAQDRSADDGDDPIPHFGFDEQSQLGQTAELSDAEQQSHADMNRSTERH